MMGRMTIHPVRDERDARRFTALHGAAYGKIHGDKLKAYYQEWKTTCEGLLHHRRYGWASAAENNRADYLPTWRIPEPVSTCCRMPGPTSERNRRAAPSWKISSQEWFLASSRPEDASELSSFGAARLSTEEESASRITLSVAPLRIPLGDVGPIRPDRSASTRWQRWERSFRELHKGER